MTRTPRGNPLRLDRLNRRVGFLGLLRGWSIRFLREKIKKFMIGNG
jgi:hypothetical protein